MRNSDSRGSGGSNNGGGRYGRQRSGGGSNGGGRGEGGRGEGSRSESGRSEGGGRGQGAGGRRFGGGRGGSGGGGSWRGGGGGGRRQGGGGGRGRFGRSDNNSGNLRERIAIESGHMVIIDQFMLANPQLHRALLDLIDSDPTEKNEVIKKFGGVVIELSPGNYRILRNPYSCRIVIHDSSHDEVDFEEIIANAPTSVGKVMIDTRCLAMIDRELLDDTELLSKYQELWFSDQDKACRDLLRDNGGAVRYGFQRFGDELDVYHLASDNTVCLAAKEATAEAVEDAA